MVVDENALVPRRAIVTWVDILGYRAMLLAGDYSKAHGASRALTRFKANEGLGWEEYRDTFAVSDAVIRVVDAQAPESQGALFYELLDMAINQLNTVLNGVVVSGGMCLGEICLGTADHRTPMGEAVGRAYELDERRWEPAICVDDDVIAALLSDSSLRMHGLQQEANYSMPWLFEHEQHFFVNYLSGATEDEGELHDALTRHREIIVNNYGSTDIPARARAKYRFMRDYHNAFINWLMSDEATESLTLGFAFAEPDDKITSILESLKIETDTHDHAIRFWNCDASEFVTYLSNGRPVAPILPATC